MLKALRRASYVGCTTIFSTSLGDKFGEALYEQFYRPSRPESTFITDMLGIAAQTSGAYIGILAGVGCVALDVHLSNREI